MSGLGCIHKRQEAGHVGHAMLEPLPFGLLLRAGGAPDAHHEVGGPLPRPWTSDALGGHANAEVARSLFEEHLPEKEGSRHLYGVCLGYEGDLRNAAHLVGSLVEVPDVVRGAELLSALQALRSELQQLPERTLACEEPVHVAQVLAKAQSLPNVKQAL